MREPWSKSTADGGGVNKLMSTEATLANVITAGVMAEAVIGGWRMSDSESNPNPRPGKIVVFEDFYWRGFGNPCHPFLRKLCDYYRVSICNLHPNSILAVFVFITLCKSYLYIQPHFNLWRHFFPKEERRCGRIEGSWGSLPKPS
jgi:hypothetical protein